MVITIKYYDNTQITINSVEEVRELPAAQVSVKTYGNSHVTHRNVFNVQVTGFYAKDNS